MKLFYLIISHSVNKICFHTLAKIFRDPPQSFLGYFQDGESSDQIQPWDVQNLTTHHFLNICFLTLKKKKKNRGKTQQKSSFRDELTKNFLSHFFTYMKLVHACLYPLVHKMMIISSVQLLIRVWLFVTTWTTAHQASLSITNSRSLLKLMFMESVMPSNHLILCHPLLIPPSILPSIRVRWLYSL